MKKNKGFTLLIAIITTSMLLLVSFIIANISLGQIIIALASEASQHAFYSADSATECAIYWDVKNPTANPPGSVSAFDDNPTQQPIVCNNNSITPKTVVSTGDPKIIVTTFSSSFPDGCADVTVVKTESGVGTPTTIIQTTIDVQGYNTCDSSSLRRFARGITISY